MNPHHSDPCCSRVKCVSCDKCCKGEERVVMRDGYKGDNLDGREWRKVFLGEVTSKLRLERWINNSKEYSRLRDQRGQTLEVGAGHIQLTQRVSEPWRKGCSVRLETTWGLAGHGNEFPLYVECIGKPWMCLNQGSKWLIHTFKIVLWLLHKLGL